MKRFIMILAAFSVLTTMVWAEDGAALYKSKCAMCHGAMGEGKVGPSLQKTSLSEKQIADLLANGAAGKKAPHSKGVAGLSADQVTAVATYVASLKK
jgi:mono/diheme cytochrome c family protein